MKIAGRKVTKFGRRVYWTSLGCGAVPVVGVGLFIYLAGAMSPIMCFVPWIVGSTAGAWISRAVMDRMTRGDRALTEGSE